MTLSTQWLSDLLALLYPNICPACDESVLSRNEFICIACERKLPRTHFHLEKENAFTERFWGRLPIFAGAALFYFVKGGRTQKLIHHLKYKGRKDLAFYFGKRYGKQLKVAPLFSDIDAIVSVPLHPKKERSRGYNQALCFASGLAESMDLPLLSGALKRISYASSQTEKSRIDRLENVLHSFELNQPERIRGKHILLVDDVLTTGATLEACGIKILAVEDTKISLLTLAIAN